MTSCTVMYFHKIHEKYMTPQKSCTNIDLSCTGHVLSCINCVFCMYNSCTFSWYSCTGTRRHVLVHDIVYQYTTAQFKYMAGTWDSCTGTWHHVLVHKIMYQYMTSCIYCVLLRVQYIRYIINTQILVHAVHDSYMRNTFKVHNKNMLGTRQQVHAVHTLYMYSTWHYVPVHNVMYFACTAM